MDQIFNQSPPIQSRPIKSPSPPQQQPLGNPYQNPMDAAVDPISNQAAPSSSTSWNSNYNNNKKKKKKNFKFAAGEQINPDLLSRITSED